MINNIEALTVLLVLISRVFNSFDKRKVFLIMAITGGIMMAGIRLYRGATLASLVNICIVLLDLIALFNTFKKPMKFYYAFIDARFKQIRVREYLIHSGEEDLNNTFGNPNCELVMGPFKAKNLKRAMDYSKDYYYSKYNLNFN